MISNCENNTTKPAINQNICIVLKSQDINSDDIVSSNKVKINDIYAVYYDALPFLNINGSPLNKKGVVYDLINYNDEIGSR